MRLYDYLSTVIDLPTMHVIVADSVARQIDELPDSQRSPSAADYGVVAPPFPQFFIEATSHDNGRKVQRGAWIEDVTDQQPTTTSHGYPAGTHWILRLSAFMLMNGRNLHSYRGVAHLHLDSNGRMLDDTECVSVAVVPPVPNTTPLPAAAVAEYVPFSFMAISAMHRRVDVEHVTPTRQQRRQAQRKRGIEKLTDYYVLKVGKTAVSDFSAIGGSGTSGSTRRHVVRGHFRYYSEERPLFGRISGMVWIPDHERGSADSGAVDKDYEV